MQLALRGGPAAAAARPRRAATVRASLRPAAPPPHGWLAAPPHGFQRPPQVLAAYNAAYSGASYTPEEPAGPPKDIITRTFEFCGTLANGFAAVAVRRATDVVAALAPDATPRQNVETAVKGGLALVALALLKSVLSTVLAVGAAALGVYTVTQVFGFSLGGPPAGATAPRAPPPGADWQQAPSGPSGWPGAAPGGQQQQQVPWWEQAQYGGGPGAAAPGAPPGGGWAAPSQGGPRFMQTDSGDVVDVWWSGSSGTSGSAPGTPPR